MSLRILKRPLFFAGLLTGIPVLTGCTPGKAPGPVAAAVETDAQSDAGRWERFNGRVLSVEAHGEPAYPGQRNRDWQIFFKDRSGRLVGTNKVSTVEYGGPIFYELESGEVLYDAEVLGWGTGIRVTEWSLHLGPVRQRDGSWTQPRSLASGWAEGYGPYFPPAENPSDFFGLPLPENVPAQDLVIVHRLDYSIRVVGNQVSVIRSGAVYLADWDHADQPEQKHFVRLPVNEERMVDLAGETIQFTP